MLQPSLFDCVADATDTSGLRGLDATSRLPLEHGAWVDALPGWLTGGDVLLARLIERVDWQAERRQMYDRMVDVPRLTRFYGQDEPWPDPLLTRMRDVLSAHYADELGEPFVTAGLCLYRDGRDSVAWHGDRIGRSRSTDTMVAIVSLGGARTLALRPVGGGRSTRIPCGHGDLVVMGGSCQRTYDHAIPKTQDAVGPRVSIQYRVRGVR